MIASIAAFITAALVPICATIDPPQWLLLLQRLPETSFIQNFMKPKRTPVTLSTRPLRVRLAMSIFLSPAQTTIEQNPIW